MSDSALPDVGGSAAQLEGIDFVSYSAAKRLLEWRDVIGCIADAYSVPSSEAEIPSRTVARSNRTWLRCLPAVPPASRYFGAKLMGGAFAPAAGVRPGVQYVIVLFDRQTSRIAAFVDANLVTAFRTAATSAVALDRLASAAPIRLGVLGSGLEATTHVQAFAETRRIERLSVFSPTPQHRETFAASATTELDIQATAVDSAEAAIDGATVVLAAARSRGERPILHGDWLRPGMVVISIGSTVPEQREIDASVVSRCDLIVCDVVEEVVHETGDMIEAARAGVPFVGKCISLGALVRGDVPEMAGSSRLPLFKSVGSGLQDIVVAEHLLRKAQEAGLTTTLPIEFSLKS